MPNVVPCSASFDLWSKPNRIKLSAVATMATSLELGGQPGKRMAVSLLALMVLPSSLAMPFHPRFLRAATRTSQFGSSHVDTLLPALPMRRRSTFATSLIHKLSPAIAKSRSPLAAGCVMARPCRSATSRTSTKRSRCRNWRKCGRCRSRVSPRHFVNASEKRRIATCAVCALLPRSGSCSRAFPARMSRPTSDSSIRVIWRATSSVSAARPRVSSWRAIGALPGAAPA